MPVSTMIVLVGVVCALAWAQLQTRHLTGTSAPAGAANRPKRRPF